MSERRDDTPEQDEESRAVERKPGDYYYDDATGYEIYDPTKDHEAEEEDERKSEE